MLYKSIYLPMLNNGNAETIRCIIQRLLAFIFTFHNKPHEAKLHTKKISGKDWYWYERTLHSVCIENVAVLAANSIRRRIGTDVNSFVIYYRTHSAG